MEEMLLERRNKRRRTEQNEKTEQGQGCCLSWSLASVWSPGSLGAYLHQSQLCVRQGPLYPTSWSLTGGDWEGYNLQVAPCQGQFFGPGRGQQWVINSQCSLQWGDGCTHPPGLPGKGNLGRELMAFFKRDLIRKSSVCKKKTHAHIHCWCMTPSLKTFWFLVTPRRRESSSVCMRSLQE